MAIEKFSSFLTKSPIHKAIYLFSSTLFCISFFASCATSPMIQPQVNSLTVAGQYRYAIKMMDEQHQSYGANNTLLYWLDYAMVLHLAGRYQESISAFETAKKIYDQMYTVSLTKEAMTWLVNDNSAPYRGEDFERVMINVFEALNYVMLGNIEEALVEARDVDSKLSLMNRQYKPDQKNVYKEDAFARFLMGILYEMEGSSEGINDAFISYAKALDVYESDYKQDYDINPPRILVENLLAAAEYIQANLFEEYKSKFRNVAYMNLRTKNQKAEIYVIHYNGLSPVKHPIEIPIPLPNGYLTKLSFPQYDERIYSSVVGLLEAVGRDGKKWISESTLAEDISAIAVKNLQGRRVRVLAKAGLRSAGKYFLEQMQGNNIDNKYGGNAREGFQYISSLYNVFSEQADLRSWQTLPGEIRIARLILDPGEYKLSFNQESLAEVTLKAGEKKFFIVRTVQY